MIRLSLSNKIKKIVILLIVIELTSIFLMIKSYKNKPEMMVLDEVKYKKLEPKEIKYSIMLESNGEYIETKILPKQGYIYDQDKSGCIDKDGEMIYINGVNVLSYNSELRKVELLTEDTELCYLYFNKEDN